MPSPSVLPTRLRTIVDVVFEGNAARAAEAAELSASAFHRLLTGSITNPRIATVQKLAKGFGVSVEWLLGGSVVGQAGAGRGTEAYQLLRAHYTAEQAPLRRRLREATKKGRQGRPVPEQVTSEFSLDPLDPTSVLYATLVPLLDTQLRDQHQLRLVRSLLEAETAVLELAVAESRTRLSS